MFCWFPALTFSSLCGPCFYEWLFWFSDFAESPAPWATEACGWWSIPKNFCIHQRCDRSSSFDDCTIFLCFSFISNPKFACSIHIWAVYIVCSGKPIEVKWPNLQCGQPQQWSNSEAARWNDDWGRSELRLVWFFIVLVLLLDEVKVIFWSPAGLCKGKRGTFAPDTNHWYKLWRILRCRLWWQWQENSWYDHHQQATWYNAMSHFLSYFPSIKIISDFNWTTQFCSGWNPKTSLWDLLESTLTYQHRTYAEAIKQATAKPAASS